MAQSETSEPQISPDLLIRRSGTVLVYLADDANLGVRYDAGNTKISPECQKFLSKVRISESVPTSYLSIESRRPWKQTLGEATAQAIEGDLKSAEALYAEADAYLQKRAKEAARMWYVQANLALILIFVTLYYAFDFSLPYLVARSQSSEASTQLSAAESAADRAKRNDDNTYTIKYMLLATIGGLVGAGFSLLLRVRDLNVDPAAGRRAAYGEVVFRLTIGALAGFIIIVGWQADVFATFMKHDLAAGVRASGESFRGDFWKLIVMALAAGASERMVPSLLEQLADRTADENVEPE